MIDSSLPAEPEPRRGKDDAYALLVLPYQVTQLMYKQYSNVVIPQPVPSENIYTKQHKPQ